jgi:hypothetical protein
MEGYRARVAAGCDFHFNASHERVAGSITQPPQKMKREGGFNENETICDRRGATAIRGSS